MAFLSTSSSNEPPFSIKATTKRAFDQGYKILISSLNCFGQTTYLHRRRRLWRSQSADGLPLYMNDYICEMYRNQNNNGNPFSLGKTSILSLAFQAIVGLAPLAFQAPSPPPPSSSSSTTTGQRSDVEDVSSVVPLHVVQVALVIAFATAFSGVFVKQVNPRVAWLFEMIGSLFFAVGFFVMTSIFIPKSLRWICWLAFSFSLLVFFRAFL